MGDALACHHRFQCLTNRTAAYASAVEGDRLVVTERRHGPPSLGSQLVSDYTMLVAVQLVRAVLEIDAPVLAIHSRRTAMPDDERAAFAAFADAPIHLGSTAAQLVLEASLLGQPVKTADAELAAYFASVLTDAARASSAVEAPALVSELSSAIRAQLPHGTPTADEMARKLGLGTRTLQRRLSSHGLSFAAVLETTRRALVEAYLDDPRLSLTEVAYLLGYTEQASFFRAFRRWYDMTPTELRGRQPR